LRQLRRDSLLRSPRLPLALSGTARGTLIQFARLGDAGECNHTVVKGFALEEAAGSCISKLRNLYSRLRPELPTLGVLANTVDHAGLASSENFKNGRPLAVGNSDLLFDNAGRHLVKFFLSRACKCFDFHRAWISTRKILEPLPVLPSSSGPITFITNREITHIFKAFFIDEHGRSSDKCTASRANRWEKSLPQDLWRKQNAAHVFCPPNRSTESAEVPIHRGPIIIETVCHKDLPRQPGILADPRSQLVAPRNQFHLERNGKSPHCFA